MPAKTGIDVATQILEGDVSGICFISRTNLIYTLANSLLFSFQLFDFNTEVKPILEVLVGKTIEQSLIEVMEEEELAALRKQQREYEELRNAEKVEQQRLEEQERRLREEKVIHSFFSRFYHFKLLNLIIKIFLNSTDA